MAQIAGPGVASLHTARRRHHLRLIVMCGTSAHGPPPPPSWPDCRVRHLCTRPAAATILVKVVSCTAFYTRPDIVSVGAAIFHQELWTKALGARPLHVAPCESVKLDQAQRKRKG